MKIKLVFLALLTPLFSDAQSLEDKWYFDASAGAAQAFGSMTKPNAGLLIYNGDWGGNLGFSKYSSEGQLMKRDLIGFHFGYGFHMNQLKSIDLDQINPRPTSIVLYKFGQLLHGPFMRLEYTQSGRFAPYIGVGAHLLALRGPKFDLDFDPQENYYRQAQYSTSAWGRINGCFSAYGGLRFVLPGDWSLGLNYELFLRNSWNSKYKVKAIPAAIDKPEQEYTFILTQSGWNQRVELRLQFPLR